MYGSAVANGVLDGGARRYRSRQIQVPLFSVTVLLGQIGDDKKFTMYV